MNNKNIKADIVVGLGYGDEGKGITTDFLCSKSENPIVIRYSGGQQAGHTVMYNGVKHIHSNFGSGSLRGVPTYFSEHTTIYPVTIARELKVLKGKGIDPELTIHPLAMITTPYDVYANRVDVDNLSHGTCGLGVGKTMKRNEGPFKLYAIDLLDPSTLMDKVRSIRENYYCGVIVETNEFLIELEEFLEAILDSSINWNIKGYNYLLNYSNLIFEGSQGILLDMDHGVFPHVTYSNTTSKNAHQILDKISVTNRNMYYITRCYSTRHGSGPFIENTVTLINNTEEINVNNEYQKNFKLAKLSYVSLNHALMIDDIYSNGKTVTKNLVVTCLDQLPLFKLKEEYLEVKFDSIYESYSPESKDYKLKTEKTWDISRTIAN
jgi:adenylosuccinate synthase